LQYRSLIIASINKCLEYNSKIYLQKFCCPSSLPYIKPPYDACLENNQFMIYDFIPSFGTLKNDATHQDCACCPRHITALNTHPLASFCSYKRYELKISMAGKILHV